MRCFAVNADHCSREMYKYMGARGISTLWRSYMGRSKRRLVDSLPPEIWTRCERLNPLLALDPPLFQ
jgi:hypothetical protein